jgi:tight adherence protein B
MQRWLAQAGVVDVEPREFLLVSGTLALVAGAVGLALFGGVLAPLGFAVFAATVPIASWRVRRSNRMATAAEAWPQMIDEIRVLVGAAGRSIPQALFDVGLRGPAELHAAFVVAQREWLISTDFGQTTEVLKRHLADPTADATCETLLVAHEIGGADLDRRLAELAEDRRDEMLARKDARSKQAGVRFARWFVLIVPLGMALAGLSLGDGRAAYEKPSGQIMVGVALAMIAMCWLWSGRMLRLPEQDRVFDA